MQLVQTVCARTVLRAPRESIRWDLSFEYTQRGDRLRIERTGRAIRHFHEVFPVLLRDGNQLLVECPMMQLTKAQTVRDHVEVVRVVERMSAVEIGGRQS